MEIAAPQRRDLAKMREDSRQASTPRHTYIQSRMSKKLVTLLDLCVSSLRRGHANLLCIVPILLDDPRRESTGQSAKKVLTLLPPGITSATDGPSLLMSPCLLSFVLNS